MLFPIQILKEVCQRNMKEQFVRTIHISLSRSFGLQNLILILSSFLNAIPTKEVLEFQECLFCEKSLLIMLIIGQFRWIFLQNTIWSFSVLYVQFFLQFSLFDLHWHQAWFFFIMILVWLVFWTLGCALYFEVITQADVISKA